MKLVLQVIAIVVISYFVMLLPLPWYSVALVAFIFGYLLKSNANFLGGFLAIALLWLIKIWMIESASDADLASRVAQLFPVKEKHWLILLTAIIGGLVGGFAALTGSLLKPGKRKATYY